MSNSQKEAAAGAESAPDPARVSAADTGTRLRVKPPVPVRQSSTCLASAAETSLESDRKSDPCYPRSLLPNTLSIHGSNFLVYWGDCALIICLFYCVFVCIGFLSFYRIYCKINYHLQ